MIDSGEVDWFSDGEVDESIPSDLVNHSLDNPTLPDTSDVVQVAAELASPEDRRDAGVRAELYDSGCTKHISPYREDLIDFVDIPPKSFRAANKQSFSAIGAGKLTVDLPNGDERSLNSLMFSTPPTLRTPSFPLDTLMTKDFRSGLEEGSAKSLTQMGR